MQQSITVRTIMSDFANATGLSDNSVEPRRYLWTDAFAVCNYLGLYRQTGEADYLKLALKLVDQVHNTLGKHHSDSKRSGWLSGLDDEQARRHPTSGGLRIGKRQDERRSDEPFDEHLEWDRDGQYFHYLTKWMYALNRVSQVTGKSIYNQWAMELARVAHAAFTYDPAGGGAKRMVWKMSIDLSRPQVNSMGQHDPLDGLITYMQLEATAKEFNEKTAALSLETEIAEMTAMCAGSNWATEDSLGIGGLLTDAYRLVQLIDKHNLPETARLESLLRDIELSMRAFAINNQLNLPAEYRLAFRELGLAIGLHALDRMQETVGQHAEKFADAKIDLTLSSLARFSRIDDVIESFWLEPGHRSADSWQEHADINNVMLATSLAPDGYL